MHVKKVIKLTCYSLISMRPIIILLLEPSFDMALLVDLWLFPNFSQSLFVVILKLLCTDMKIKTKTIY